MKKWKRKEIAILKKNYEKSGVLGLLKILNRSYYSIQKKARKLGLRFKNKSWKDEKNFLINNKNAILTYKDIIKTFNKKEQILAFNYIKAKLLRKKGLKLNEIAKKLKISENTIRQWSSKTTPRAIRCVIKLTELELLPLVKNTSKFKTFLKIFAWIFGDGNLNNNLTSITLAGDGKTLKKLKKEIESILLLKCKLINKFTNGEFDGRIIRGSSWYLIINNAAFSRLLYAAGAPKGDKVIQPIKLPSWVFQLPKEFKSIFLGALWSCDGTKPIWHKKGFYLCFQLNKATELKENQELFMNQIRKLFNQLGIKTGKVKWSAKPYRRSKDNKKIDKCYFYISTKAENYIKFFKLIPNFSKNRENSFKIAFLLSKEKIENNKKRINLYLIAKRKFKNGNSIKEISEELKIPYSTVKAWVKGFHSPIKFYQSELTNGDKIKE